MDIVDSVAREFGYIIRKFGQNEFSRALLRELLAAGGADIINDEYEIALKERGYRWEGRYSQFAWPFLSREERLELSTSKPTWAKTYLICEAVDQSYVVDQAYDKAIIDLFIEYGADLSVTFVGKTPAEMDRSKYFPRLHELPGSGNGALGPKEGASEPVQKP